MVVLPSFEPEWAVGIESINDRFYVFSTVSTVRVWEYFTLSALRSGAIRIVHSTEESDPREALLKEIESLEKKLPRTVEDVKANYSRAAISAALATKVLEVWATILRRVRYAREAEVGFDGTTYHFSLSERGYGVMDGQTWSPEPDTINRLSVELGSLLREYSTAGRSAALEGRISALCDRLLERCKGEE
jgi:hypothetical protein